jgi:hypothetical protein
VLIEGVGAFRKATKQSREVEEVLTWRATCMLEREHASHLVARATPNATCDRTPDSCLSPSGGC